MAYKPRHIGSRTSLWRGTKYNNCNYLEIKDECCYDGWSEAVFVFMSVLGEKAPTVPSTPSDDYYRSWMHLFVPLLLSHNSEMKHNCVRNKLAN